MDLPVGEHIAPDKPLPVNDELGWDNGTPFPEPCIDRIVDTVGKTPKVYPHDSLRVEVGGEP